MIQPFPKMLLTVNKTKLNKTKTKKLNFSTIFHWPKVFSLFMKIGCEKAVKTISSETEIKTTEKKHLCQALPTTIKKYRLKFQS